MSIKFACSGNHNLTKIDIDSQISALDGFGEYVSSQLFFMPLRYSFLLVA